MLRADVSTIPSEFDAEREAMCGIKRFFTVEVRVVVDAVAPVEEAEAEVRNRATLAHVDRRNAGAKRQQIRIPIEVNVRYDSHGQLVPTSFIWQEQEYTVESTGRRWQDDVGEHILVMVEAKKVYELVHAQVERRWYLKPIGSGSRMA